MKIQVNLKWWDFRFEKNPYEIVEIIGYRYYIHIGPIIIDFGKVEPYEVI